MLKIIFITAMLLSGVGTIPALIILMMWDDSDREAAAIDAKRQEAWQKQMR